MKNILLPKLGKTQFVTAFLNQRNFIRARKIARIYAKTHPRRRNYLCIRFGEGGGAFYFCENGRAESIAAVEVNKAQDIQWPTLIRYKMLSPKEYREIGAEEWPSLKERPSFEYSKSIGWVLI